jgi:hypothetical protein
LVHNEFRVSPDLETTDSELDHYSEADDEHFVLGDIVGGWEM